jgi:hypothetical protein
MRLSEVTADQLKNALKVAYDTDNYSAIDDLTTLLRLKTGEPAQLRGAGEAPRVGPLQVPTPDYTGGEASSRSAARSVGQGMLAGATDEIAGVAPFMTELLSGQGLDAAANAYTTERDHERAAQAQYAEESPGANVANQILGTIPTMGFAARGAPRFLPKSAPLTRTVAGGGLLGGAEAIGRAEGPFSEQAIDTTIGAFAGMAGGPLMQGATHVGSKVGNAVMDAARPMWQTAEEASGEVLKRVLDRTNRTVPDVEAELAARGDGVVPGMLPEFQPLAVGRAAGTPAGRVMAQDLAQRHQDAQGRALQRTVSDLGGGGPVSYEMTLDALNTQQRRTAAADYKAAYAFETSPSETPEIMALLRDKDIKKALLRGQDAIRRKTNEKPRVLLRRQGTDEYGEPIYKWEHMPTWEELDHIQRGLRALGGDVPGTEKFFEYRMARDRFNKVVDDANPALREARTKYAGFEALQEAVQLGRNIFDKGKTAMDAERLSMVWPNMNRSEQEAFTLGVVKEMQNRLRMKRSGQNVGTDNAFVAEEFQDRLAIVFGRDGADRLLAEVNRTARNQADAVRLANRTTTSDTLNAADLTPAQVANPRAWLQTILQPRDPMADPAVADRVTQALLSSGSPLRSYMTPAQMTQAGGVAPPTNMWGTIIGGRGSGIAAPAVAENLFRPQ